MPIASRLTNTGTLLVNGSFDENTSIAPLKFRTTSNTVLAGTLDEVSLAAGSISFDGTDDYLSVANNTALQPGLDPFTIDCWIYRNVAGQNHTIYAKGGSGTGFQLRVSSLNILRFTNGSTVIDSSITIPALVWTHVAVVRFGSDLLMFINGVQSGQGTVNTNYNQTEEVRIGTNRNAQDNFNGYISCLRFIKGIALYTITGFTPQQFIPDSTANTSLLLNVLNSTDFKKDSSPNNFNVTINGNAAWNANGPFNRGLTAVKQRQITDGTLEVYSNFDEFTGAPVVDSSLQLWLDAGQTTSYPGTGTTWTDLSGNGRTGTLTSGPTYSTTNGGSIGFNGSSNYVQCAGSLTVTEATFVAWIRRNGTQNPYDGIIYCRGTGSNVTGLDIFPTNKLGYTWNALASTYNFDSNLTIPDLTWCMIAMSVTSTAATLYLCQTSGITTATNTTSHPSTVLDDIKIAQDDQGSRFFLGDIASAQIYNRALSSDEITTNFNALRNRYGI